MASHQPVRCAQLQPLGDPLVRRGSPLFSKVSSVVIAAVTVVTGLALATPAASADFSNVIPSQNPIDNTPHVLNNQARSIAQVGDRVVIGGSFTQIQNANTQTIIDQPYVFSFDPVTGNIIKQGRLHGAIDKYFSSPVAADDKVFLIGQGGQVSVVKAAGDWEVLAVNELDDECYATPAIADGHIYIRTRSALYAFGK